MSSNSRDKGDSVYNVFYFGFLGCNALRGQDITEPVVKTFIYGEDETGKPNEPVVAKPAVLEVSEREVSLMEMVKKKNDKTEWKRLLSTNVRDVTYAAPGFPPNNDIFVVIMLNSGSKNKFTAPSAHAFRCDTAEITFKIVDRLMTFVNNRTNKEYVRRVEEDLVRRKLIEPSVERTASSRSTWSSGNKSTSISSGDDTVNLNSKPPSLSSYEPRQSYENGRPVKERGDFYQNFDSKLSGDSSNRQPGSRFIKRSTISKPPIDEPPVDYSDEEDEIVSTVKDTEELVSDTVAQEEIDPTESIMALDDVLKEPQTKESQLYDNLAGELRRKLGKTNGSNGDEGPLLLPPKDYDTIHRNQGKLENIEERRSQNSAIIGQKSAVWGPEEVSNEKKNSDNVTNVGKLRPSQLRAVEATIDADLKRQSADDTINSTLSNRDNQVINFSSTNRSAAEGSPAITRSVKEVVTDDDSSRNNVYNNWQITTNNRKKQADFNNSSAFARQASGSATNDESFAASITHTDGNNVSAAYNRRFINEDNDTLLSNKRPVGDNGSQGLPVVNSNTNYSGSSARPAEFTDSSRQLDSKHVMLVHGQQARLPNFDGSSYHNNDRNYHRDTSYQRESEGHSRDKSSQEIRDVSDKHSDNVADEFKMYKLVNKPGQKESNLSSTVFIAADMNNEYEDHNKRDLVQANDKIANLRPTTRPKPTGNWNQFDQQNRESDSQQQQQRYSVPVNSYSQSHDGQEIPSNRKWTQPQTNYLRKR